jgi:peptide chain release factor 1
MLASYRCIAPWTRSRAATLSKQRIPLHLASYRRRTILSKAVQQRVDELMERHTKVMDELRSSSKSSQALGKELSSLSQVASLVQEKQELDEEETSMLELAKEAVDANDNELLADCQREIDDFIRRKDDIDKRILDAILPSDDDDFDSDAIIEIRAGTGGDEASLFAAEILLCYIKTAKSLNWNTEMLSENKTDIGGIREAALSIMGHPKMIGLENTVTGPFGAFKFESGVHRVQRVPVNDSRIHTSACSVGVLPALKMDDKESIPLSELKFETMRSSGAGGQHVNTTDSAVRITHIPTGIQASIQDERSQHKNKEKALKLITARVRDLQRMEREKERGELKSSLMGGGDRSERIRTYNYPQDRVSDHRSKATRYGIDSLLNGAVADDGLVLTFLPELKALRREELLNFLEDR